MLFLVTLAPTIYNEQEPDPNLPFVDQYGVKAVRGCEVVELRDEEGNYIRDFEQENSPRAGSIRTVKVKFDTSQYHFDITQKDEDVYGTFNLIVRRKPKENNFKAVLETIRDLMTTKTSLPEWLNDVFLGYGDPTALKKSDKEFTIDLNDTFLDIQHLISSFPGKSFTFFDAGGKKISEGDVKKGKSQMVPPFKITFPPTGSSDALKVQSYSRVQLSPFQVAPKANQIPFTPIQVDAITSGTHHGLTLVMGPPGTGKTDVAVQIISNWYHNNPESRTLLVTHSNQALNQLFEKIVELDIDERHLLRLGHGEELLTTEKDFSKYGRVNYMLARRLELLTSVDLLAKSLHVKEDVAYTCETAEQFNISRITPMWEAYYTKAVSEKSADYVRQSFPFLEFFAGAPKPIFQAAESDFAKVLEAAMVAYRHIKSLFDGLSECRPFELLRNPADRGNYLLTKQAKIVAMTCTHAALKVS